MKKHILFFFIIFLGICGIVSAQENSVGMESSQKGEVLLAAFDPIMYFNDADKDIARVEGLSYSAIREKLQLELERAILYQLIGKEKTISLLISSFPEDQLNLQKLHASISYKYQNVNGKESLANNVRRGELKPSGGKEEKFMNAYVLDDKMYKQLAKQYEIRKEIIINQFEIKNAFTDQYEIASGKYKRVLKVHYSILDNNGFNIKGGVAETAFTSETGLNEIIKNNLPVVAAQIITTLQVGNDKK